MGPKYLPVPLGSHNKKADIYSSWLTECSFPLKLAEFKKYILLGCTWRPLTFIDSWIGGLVFISYILLNLVFVSVVHANTESKSAASLMMVAVLISKLMVSVLIFRLFEGSFDQLIKIMKQNKKELLLFIAPAISYGIADCLVLYCLQVIDPATFSILFNIRIVFLLFFFQKFLGVPLFRIHWIAILLIIAGCVIKELPQFMKVLLESTNEITLTSEISSGFRMRIILLVIAGAQLAAFAGVYNEKLLKEQKLSLNIQNIALYIWGLAATIICSFVSSFYDSGSAFSQLFEMKLWAVVFTYPYALTIPVLAAYGLLTSYFLRTLDSVIREIAGALRIMLTIPLNAYLWKYKIVATDIISVILVLIGVAVFNRSPLKVIKQHQSKSCPGSNAGSSSKVMEVTSK